MLCHAHPFSIVFIKIAIKKNSIRVDNKYYVVQGAAKETVLHKKLAEQG